MCCACRRWQSGQLRATVSRIPASQRTAADGVVIGGFQQYQVPEAFSFEFKTLAHQFKHLRTASKARAGTCAGAMDALSRKTEKEKLAEMESILRDATWSGDLTGARKKSSLVSESDHRSDPVCTAMVGYPGFQIPRANAQHRCRYCHAPHQVC